MPGPQIRNWELYEKLIAKGYSKETAAKIANAQEKADKPKKKK
jgi:hypothetical protein